MRGGVLFVVSLFLYLFFEQGKKRHVEEKVMAKGGGRVKRGGGLRRAAA